MQNRLLLVRHGRVDFGSKDFRDTPRGRQWDPPLDATGAEQAAKLARRLASMPLPSAVFVSPFRRCLETMQPFTDLTGIRGEITEELGEVYVGEWEGVSFEDLIAEHEDLVRRRVDDGEPLHNLAPGAESGTDLRARVVPAVEAMMERATGGTVLMVTHGGVINAYLGHVMGLAQDMFFLPDNTSINSVEVDGPQRRVRFLNDTAHVVFPALWPASPGH